MKKAFVAAVAIAALPVMAHAQSPTPGFYGGVEGGVSWLLNTTIAGQGVYPATGWAAGGKFGYDFIGPRVEVEGVYHENQYSGANFPGQAIQGKIGQAAVMANILYDFNAGGVIVPFIGAGAGVGFIDSDLPLRSTQFAYQGILGVGWNATQNLRFDLSGDGRGCNTEVASFDKLYPSLRPGELIDGTADPRFRDAWAQAQADSFAPAS